MRFIVISLVFICLVGTGCHQPFEDHNETIDLSGTWKFKLDPDNIGLQEKWFNEKLNDSIQLPGTTDENKKGIFKDEREVERLSRVWYWKGAAWYQKEVTIPENWSGKNVKLLLERTKDTYVWFDDINCGYHNTLSAPQYFDLSEAIKPGKHTITVLVDNAKLPPVGPSHAVDERTQTNWNGIVGKIELQMTDPVWIDEAQIYPDVQNNSVRIKVNIKNITGNETDGKLKLTASSWNVDNPEKFKSHTKEISGINWNQSIEINYEFDKEAPLWDEFNPAMIRLDLALTTSDGDNNYTHIKQVDFGMREFKREGIYLVNNGERVYLRGRLDCANYPITGYPPMEKEEWLELFTLLKTYGINHWRYHSWCPPKAALMAADELGVYLQPELPNKRSGMDRKSMEEEEVRKIHNIDYLEVDADRINMTLKEYLQREGELIFKYFGNHPSFVMFTLGNELGRNKAMDELVARFKDIDPRRLYARGSNNMHWDPSFAGGDDFWVTAKTTDDLLVRGSYAYHAPVEPHIENKPPSTLVDYTKSIANVPAPVIGHETGQFQVSPDFDDISKFTGVTRARNYEIFRERFKKANLIDQADDFVQASGKLAAICYREDIETALRTPDLGGFQLLDIQDFPGQGTALVGMLNVFMESKGFITPEKWRQFCSEVVPLLKMKKYTWTNDEQFTGNIEIAQYGKQDFKDAEVSWKLEDSKGALINEGTFPGVQIPRGGVVDIGEISFPLNKIEKAEKLKITLAVEGTKYKNEYDLWVYPNSVDTSIPEGIMVSERMDSKTVKHLEEGGKAIIFPDHDKLTHCIKGAFQTDFWCYPMFARSARRQGKEPAPGSLGFICDPESPLFEHFPTEFHSNWQWWHLAKNCKPIILDDTPADYKPMVQTIDNFARNHKLGMIFETKYGKGKALICAIDLLNLQDKPEARQLYYSLLNFVESNEFSPSHEISKSVLSKLLQ